MTHLQYQHGLQNSQDLQQQHGLQYSLTLPTYNSNTVYNRSIAYNSIML